jgi:hypothetical protein
MRLGPVLMLFVSACGRIGFENTQLGLCTSVGFEEMTNVQLGFEPRAVAVADFNGDRKLDFAATNGGGNSVSVQLGNGDGTFVESQTIATGVRPWSIAAGDVDGDGFVDLVIGNYGDNNFFIYYGSSTGFSVNNKTIVATGSGPQGVMIVDLDRNRRNDVVSVDYNAPGHTVAINQGSRVMQTMRSTTPGLKNPYSLASADFDHDGSVDVAVANILDPPGRNTPMPSVSVLHGNGSGSFDSTGHIVAPDKKVPWQVLAADLNDDGNVDVVVTNNYGDAQADNAISVFLGTGTLAFGARQDLPSAAHPWWVGASDFNGDGELDLVTANGEDESISLFRGAGDGSFLTRKEFTFARADTKVRHQFLTAAIGDFDRDGRSDLVVVDKGYDTAMVLLTRCE